jgi:hypothetical protein
MTRLQFVARRLAGEQTADLCRDFGIGNTQTSTPINCENCNNFVYTFFSGTGFPQEARFWLITKRNGSVNTSAFVGTNPTGELITSGLPFITGRNSCIHRAGSMSGQPHRF